MSATCRSFRALLELKLSGRAAQSELAVLSWHEHLLGCNACRKLLEAEEALELLLASLPEPNLPPELALRVVSRLRAARRQDLAETGLDALLDLALDADRSEAPPPQLAETVLAKLRTAREAAAPPTVSVRAEHGAEAGGSRLEALLDLDRAVAVPDGLAERVLAGLRSVRHDPRRNAASRFALPLRARWLLAAAALVVALWVAWTLRAHGAIGRSERREGLAHGERTPNASGAASTHDARPGVGDATPPEPEMLAVLDVLEQWDLLMHGDIDVLLSTLDPADLDTTDEASDEPVAPPPAPAVQEPRSKG